MTMAAHIFTDASEVIFEQAFEVYDFWITCVENSSDTPEDAQEAENMMFDSAVWASEYLLKNIKPWKRKLILAILKRFLFKTSKIKAFHAWMIRTFSLEEQYSSWKKNERGKMLAHEAELSVNAAELRQQMQDDLAELRNKFDMAWKKKQQRLEQEKDEWERLDEQ